MSPPEVKQLQDGRMVGNELECAMLRRMREMGDEAEWLGRQ